MSGIGGTRLRVAVVDCLAASRAGRRLTTVDVIGAGPRLVVGILRSLGVNAELMECETALYSPTDPLRGFDVLMVSGMSSDVPSMFMVLRRWKQRGPSFAGGPACVDGEKLLKMGFTGVIWGEAELSLPTLIEKLGSEDLSGIPNLMTKSGGRLVANILASYAPDPPLWSFDPDVESVRRYKYFWASRVYVEVVRGCSNFYRTSLPVLSPKKKVLCNNCGVCRSGDLELRLACPLGIPPGCGYCLVPKLYGPARSRPLDKIIREIEELLKLGVKRIVLSAPDILDYGRDWLVKPKPLTDPRNPPANVNALEALLNSVFSIPEASKGDVYVMVENIKPNLLTEDVARILGKYLRGTTVNLGLETGDEEHHIKLGRPSTVPEVLRAVKLLREAGLLPYVYVIYGLPGESWETVRRTIKTLRRAFRVGAERIVLYKFRPLRGSAFEGYRPSPPGDPKSIAMKRFVRNLELLRKRKLLGKIVRIAVVDKRGEEEYVGYTLPHGPVAVVRSKEDLRGRTLDVVVDEVRERYLICSLKRPSQG